MNVSMPFIGLISFLRIITSYKKLVIEKFQCPLSGLSHFYVKLKKFKLMERMFQCPLSGLSHFYNMKKMMEMVKNYGFNALYRAYLISTYTPETIDRLNRYVSMSW